MAALAKRIEQDPPSREDRLALMVSDLRARRAGALEQFYDQFGAAVRAIALRMVRTEADADEVLHDVAWTVYRKIDRFAGTSDFWRWVHVVTRNAALMHLRRARRHPTPYEPDDLYALHADPTLMADDPSPEDRVTASMAAERLDAVLRDSSPLNRRLFTSLVLDGIPVAEVASEAGMSVPAIKSRLHRLRHDLRLVAEAALAP